MSNPRKKRAGANTPAIQRLLDAKSKEIEYTKKINDEAARVKKVKYEPIPVLKKTEESKVKAPAVPEYKQPVIEQLETNYATIPVLKKIEESKAETQAPSASEFLKTVGKHPEEAYSLAYSVNKVDTPDISGILTTPNTINKLGTTEVDLMAELEETKKKHELGLDYYSDDEIEKMYQDAQEKASQYGWVERLLNSNAQKAQDKYQELYNERESRKLSKDYQTMLERDAYSEIVELGRAGAGLNLKYSPENFEAYNSAKEALKNKGYTDEEITALSDLGGLLARGESEEELKAFASEHPILGSAMSVGTNMLKPADLLGQGLAYLEGRPVKSEDYVLNDLTNLMREGASSDMGGVGKFFYNTGMGVIDSLASRAVAGKASPFTMAAGAAEGATQESLERGASPTEAFTTGLASGATEALFEKMELDKLDAFKQVPTKTAKNFFGNIGKQMVNEGVSEGVTEMTNVLSDYYINGDNSEFAMTVDAYEEQGLTHDEAMDAAMTDVAKRVGLNALGGAFSGGVMGAGYQMTGNLSGNNRIPTLEPTETIEQPTKQTMQDLMRLQKPKETSKVNTVNSSASLNPSQISGTTNIELEKSISEYPYNTQTVIKEYVDSVNPSIVDFARDAKQETDKKRLEWMHKDFDGVFSESIEQSISNIVNFDVHEYKTRINGETIHHIEKRHGKNGKHDHSMKDENDLARLEYVLKNADSVERTIDQNGEEVFDDQYRDANNQPSPMVTISKKINGTYYVVVATPESAKKLLRIKSVFISNNKKIETNQEFDATAPNTTSKTNLDIVSNNSIPDLRKTVNVPKTMAEDIGLNNTTSSPVAEAEFNVRGYNNSIIEKSDMHEVVKNEFIENPQFYRVLKNKDTEAMAEQIISEKGIDAAKAEFDSLVDKKEPVAIPLGYKIASQYQKDGRVNEAVEILRKMSEKLTESGQFSQAAAINLMNSDPTTALQYITREFDRLNATGKEKYKNKWKDFELTEDEKALFSNLEPGDTDGIKNAYETIYKRFQKEYPSTLMEKLVEARRIGMLLNVRTNVRNVVSNALLQPVRWSTDRVSALGQNAIKLINPDFNTTQAIYVGKKAKKLSDEAWNSVKDSILNEDSSRYNDTQKAIREKQVFKGTKASQFIDTVTGGAITKLNKVLGKDVKPSVIETARNLTYWLLEKGDNAFVANNFKSRMASYIQAQGITDLENIPADAYTLATQEALKATFKDENGLTRALSSVKKNSGILGEVILPFTKTPANLAMRGIEYSPAGVISTFKQLEKSNRTQADVSQFMDNISKQFVGTAGIALGYMLASAGFISGELSEDKDEAAFQKQQGQLPYAIHIGQNYYTYDWAQPASIPLIFGATIYQATNESDNQLNAILQGVTAATDAWFNLSPLQNVQEIFGGYGTPAENLRDAILDIPTSFVPAQLGAGARIVDPVQRQAFSNGDTLGTLKNNIIAKIPVLSKTLPAAYDTWGNEVKRSNSTGEAAFAQLFNPGQLGNAAVTPIDGEIQRLYDETGEKGVFPKKAAWSYKVDGESIPLDNEMYSQMQKLTGNTSYDIASEFINNNEYDSLTDESKAEVLSDIYSFSDAIGKSELLGYDIEGSDYAKQYNIYKESGAEGLANYLAINQSASANGSSMSDKIPVLKKMDLSDAERGEFLRNNNSRPADGAMTAYDDYGDKGFYWYYLCKLESDANGNGSMSQKELEAYLKSSSFTKQQKEYYWNLFYPKAKKKPIF